VSGDRDDWKPTSEAPQQPGTYVDVRTTTTYRWLAYKPDGARQMKAPGRWQRATEHGWENAPLPNGDFVPNLKKGGEA
jgi:hypothetical protein